MPQKIAILIEREYEDLELQYPRLRLLEAGYQVKVVGPQAEEVYKGKNGYPQRADMASADVRVNEFDMFVVPGGFAPDFMRRDQHMLRIVREAVEADVPIAAICHGVWMLCSSGGLRGKRCTSFYAIAADVVNAGGKWVDEECVVDGGMITSRNPNDLPSFMQAVLSVLKHGSAEGTRGSPAAPKWIKQVIGQSAPARSRA